MLKYIINTSRVLRLQNHGLSKSDVEVGSTR